MVELFYSPFLYTYNRAVSLSYAGSLSYFVSCTVALLLFRRINQQAIQMVCINVYIAGFRLLRQRSGRISFARAHNAIIPFIYQAIYMEKYRPFTTLVWNITSCTILLALVLSCTCTHRRCLDRGLFLST